MAELIDKPRIRVTTDGRVLGPRALDTFFENRECPDCGGDRWNCWEDGGHDIAIECLRCHACFGVQMPPFNLIERIHR
jgi:hypothetical protein